MPDPESPYSGWEREELVFLAEASCRLASCPDETAVLEQAAYLPVPFLAERSAFEPEAEGGGGECPADAQLEPGRIVVPLQSGEERFGTLILWAGSGRVYHPHDLAVAEELGKQVSCALAPARRFCSVQKALAEAERREAALRQAHDQELKRRDADFGRFVRTSPMGIAIAPDRNCQTILVNPTLAELLGIEPPDDGPLTPLPEGTLLRFYREQQPLPPEDLPLHHACAHGVEVRGAEFDVVREDGSACTLFGHAIPLFDEEGTFKAGIATFLDMTVRKRAEEALAQADRNKDMFIALLGHELRTPLAAMSNAVYLIRRRSKDHPPILSATEMLERQLAQAVRMVEDLQNVSRIKRGRLHLERSCVDLVALAGHALEVMRHQAEKRGVEILSSLPPGPVHTEVDAGRIEQVMTNLLGNAIKYTDAGGRIWFSLESGRDSVTIRVRDTGIGIPPELLATAFDLYKQADGALPRSQGGLGIGLALVQGLVELHGGSVAASSEGPEYGSEFTVTLPRHSAHGKDGE